MSDSESIPEENFFCSTCNEFIWMWLASVSPIFLTVLFVFIDGKELSFYIVLKDIFLSGPIFAYVATLVAPFIFATVQILKGKKKQKVNFAGLSILIAFIVAILSTGLFFKTQSLLFDKQTENRYRQHLIEIIPVEVVDAAKVELDNLVVEDVNRKSELGSVERLSILCYILSLFIYFHSIYINKRPPMDPNEASRKSTKKMSNVISKLTGSGK